MRLKHAGLLGAFVCVPCIAAPALASAADTKVTLEEVVVTAERRTSDVQRTPASVSVRSGEELAAQGRYTTRQILQDIPGIVAVDNSSLNVGTADVQGNNITIRGITPGSSAGGGPSQIAAAPGAAVYVDGVYEGAGSGYDIERVEVLRGPQGTLYGRSATTGVVAFHTRNPSMDGFDASVGAEFGNYDLQHYNGAVNIPLDEKLAVRLSGDYRKQGKPFYETASRGKGERKQARAKILFEPSDNLSILVGGAYDHYEAFSGGKTRTWDYATNAITVNSNREYPGVKDQRQVWAEMNWDLGSVTLTYLPSFRSWKQNDALTQSSNFLQSGAGQLQSIHTPKDNFNTQELRIGSNNDAKIKWLAGLFYYQNTLHTTNHNGLINNATGAEVGVLSDSIDDKETKNIGVFAEATIPLTDSLRVTLGGRYDDTQVVVAETLFDNPYALCGTSLAFAASLPPGAFCTGVARASVPAPGAVTISGVKLKFQNFTYKARLEYDLTPNNMVYGMVSTAFRPGDAGISNRKPNLLDAEELTSFEFGSKNRFFNDTLQVNAGVYYYLYDGFQTSYRPDTANPADYAGIGSAVAVTVPARNIGGELELLYQMTQHDRLGANFSYVQSRWHDKPAGFAAAQTEKRRAMTPYSISANYEHRFDLPGGSNFSARIDGKYEAAHLGSNLHIDLLRPVDYSHYTQVDAQMIGNLTGTWVSSDARFSVSAYVRNFTDEVYTTYQVGGDLHAMTVNWTDPRTYGVTLAANF